MAKLVVGMICFVTAKADENVFKKGFVVDVNVRSIGGRPIAYAVTNVHQIIDLP
jgi:hypothetical protein